MSYRVKVFKFTGGPSPTAADPRYLSGWHFDCSCGFRTLTGRSFDQALRDGLIHAELNHYLPARFDRAARWEVANAQATRPVIR